MKKQSSSTLQDFKKLEAQDDFESFKEKYNTLIDELNQRLKGVPLESLSGQIVTAVLPASSETRISHSLKIVPKYVLRLGQTGDGVVTDAKGLDTTSGLQKWNKQFITLENNGSVEVTLTMMILRE